MGTGTDCALRVPSFVSATSSEDTVLRLIVQGQEAARCRGNVLLSFQSQGCPVPRAARLVPTTLSRGLSQDYRGFGNRSVLPPSCSLGSG